MERQDLKSAEQIFGKNFIGPSQLKAIEKSLGVTVPANSSEIPLIPFSIQELQMYSETHILLLQVAYTSQMQHINILSLRDFFGTNAKEESPVFYPQDWYINEKFARTLLSLKWVLLQKELEPQTRGKLPDSEALSQNKLPSAITCTYAFFAYYLHTSGGKLWEFDYIWCSDLDASGDRIYVGRYTDPAGLANSGFSIHRHLSIKQNYGSCLIS